MKRAIGPALNRVRQDFANVGNFLPDVLLPLTNDYAARLSASEIAKAIGIPRRTVSHQLNKLLRLNVVSHTIGGKNKLFYLDLKSETAKTTLTLVESWKALRFQLTTPSISPVIDDFLKHAEAIIVFGSYSAGNFDESSDLDVVVLGKCDRHAIMRIKQRQVIEINEHYASFLEFEKILVSRNPLAIEIMRNHVLFGDISRAVRIFWRRAYEQR